MFMGENGFRVKNLRGTVTVTSAAGPAPVVLGANERSDVWLGQAPSPPISGTINLVRNSDFSQSLPPEWQAGSFGPSVEGAVLGEVSRHQPDSGEPSLYFRRLGAEGSSADLFVRQEFAFDALSTASLIPEEDQTLSAPDQEPGLDIRVAEYLGIRLKFRILHQSLAGGGEPCCNLPESEYPLIVRLRSIDFDSLERDGCEWTVGFYAVPAGRQSQSGAGQRYLRPHRRMAGFRKWESIGRQQSPSL